MLKWPLSLTKALQPHATTCSGGATACCSRNEARQQCHEKHSAPYHGVLTINSHSGKPQYLFLLANRTSPIHSSPTGPSHLIDQSHQTIFSMSSFFTLDSQTFQLHVSSDFWIFWAIAIPLTGLVVFIWTLWIQRTEVKNIRQRLKAWWKARQAPRPRKAKDEEEVREVVVRIRDEAEFYQQPSRAMSDQRIGNDMPQEGRLLHRFTV
jgi:hypothetical protein